ncbi:aminoglycoside phosphotransferase family protein [Marinilactibacillus psychrotolerans]|uniref:Aminoglycoside phosphotransferase family protein n=1 Tax=Marinilactibacillus psychrotolerans TaxID=191770 RepID=A0ABW8UH66_9LACT
MTMKRKLVGKGAVSNIYLDNGFAYKVYSEEYPLDWIEYEVNIQREVIQKTKLRVPNVEFLKNNREIKMDYIDGYTLGERMRKEKYKASLDDLVAIQLSIHQYSHLNLPQSHEVFQKQLEESDLDESLKNKALKILQQIQIKQNLCHFDFHFLNIMYDHKDYYIIDWVNAKLGNPTMDIARTYVILKQYAQRLANRYLKLIVEKENFNIDEIRLAIPLMATLRLLEDDTVSFRDTLLELIQSY